MRSDCADTPAGSGEPRKSLKDFLPRRNLARSSRFRREPTSSAADRAKTGARPRRGFQCRAVGEGATARRFRINREISISLRGARFSPDAGNDELYRVGGCEVTGIDVARMEKPPTSRRGDPEFCAREPRHELASPSRWRHPAAIDDDDSNRWLPAGQRHGVRRPPASLRRRAWRTTAPANANHGGGLNGSLVT